MSPLPIGRLEFGEEGTGCRNKINGGIRKQRPPGEREWNEKEDQQSFKQGSSVYKSSDSGLKSSSCDREGAVL